MKITKTLAKKVLEVVDAGLCSGKGIPVPGQMCVEAAVCYALGEPHSDEPSCVSPALRRFKIRLNDSEWSSNEARTKGLRRIAIAQLGTAGTLDETEFAKRISEAIIRKILPKVFRLVAQQIPDHKDNLLAAADRCEKEGTKEAANAADAAYAAADAAARAAAYAAYAAYAADAAYAVYAAVYAAYAAAKAANAANAYYAAADVANAAADEVLSETAELATQILIDLGTPGSKFLSITE
jgi:hypothetical protein